jgi:hypothetical protein
MILLCRSGVLCVPLAVAAVVSGYAQQQEAVTPPATPAQAQAAAPRVQTPDLLEDGGISLEPFYWFTTFLAKPPTMKGGAASAASNADLNYPGIIRDAPGAILSIPAGPQSTIRISYLRMQGRGDETLASSSTLLGTPFAQGDWLSTRFLLQDVKVSWDFLTYPVKPLPGKLRFKTLWEAQWVTFSTYISAPYAPVTTDSSGNTVSNYTTVTKSLILPTLGGELEQAPFRHFRYELKASGFTIPHHANIWDAEGSVAFRFGKLELLAGAKAFHFKTSPKSDEYFAETLSGPYAGLRFYLNRQE